MVLDLPLHHPELQHMESVTLAYLHFVVSLAPALESLHKISAGTNHRCKVNSVGSGHRDRRRAYIPTWALRRSSSPFRGPRRNLSGRNVHCSPCFIHGPHRGRILSHLTFRDRHDSQVMVSLLGIDVAIVQSLVLLGIVSPAKERLAQSLTVK